MMSERNDYLIDKAYEFASSYHKTQKRKYTNEPYIVHPINVAKIIENAFCKTNELYQYFDKSTIRTNIIIGALLHDTVEDTDATFVDIENKFGIKVRNIVYYVTNISKLSDGNRQIRKRIDIHHVLSGPIESIMIKLADIIDNCNGIMKKDFSFGKIYIKEKELFLQELDKILNEKYLKNNNDDLLYKVFNNLLIEAKGVINNENKYNI